MNSWRVQAGRWTPPLVAMLVAVAGCNRAPTHAPPPPATTISFDGGMPPVELPPPLPGNVLALDGGATDTTPRFGQLDFVVIDHDTQLPMPSRVIFRPPPGAGFSDSIVSGTPNETGANSATGAVVGPGVVGSIEGVLLQTGIGSVPVPPGTYDVFINRGPEWEAVEAHVSVTAGKRQLVRATLERSVDTRGWIAADMHVHMETSFDSKVPQDRRVISMASSGIELMVTTDHHHIVDTLPLVRALGYGPGEMTALSGDELNFNEGHAGLYPVAFDPNKPQGGSPPYQGYNGRPGRCDQPWLGTNCYSDIDAFPLMHSLYPNAVLTLNHPWWQGGNLGYFTNIEWGAGTMHPLPTPLRTAGLFDAIEVLNGYWTKANAEQALLSDWFFLLSQGHRITALGSSDTHRINWVRAGFPRSWIRLPTEKPGDVTPGDFADAVKHGRVIASTGPFLTMTVDGGEIGDLVLPRHHGQVTVDITADAPNWMGLDTVQLFVDGVSYQKWSVQKGQRPLFTTTLTVPVTTDTWMVVIAGGKKPLPPDVVGEFSHANEYEMLPWALTNPIYIDWNGDGWHPVKTWRGSPVLDAGDYGWDSVPASASARLPSSLSREAGGPVPVDCDPGNKRPFETEPPLDAMQLALPLLYP
jgi:hypothetical protein